jgi:hypothetical protein
MLQKLEYQKAAAGLIENNSAPIGEAQELKIVGIVPEISNDEEESED